MAENDIPELVRLTLDTVPALQKAVLLEVFLEREVSLGDGARNSQTDLLCLLSIKKQLVVMSVEGKVREPFGNIVAKEHETASAFKKSHIERLAQVLGLSLEDAKPLRYQLIHRTAAAIFEAKRFHSRTAVMMVHSFDPADAGFADYRLFANAIGFRDVEPLTPLVPSLSKASHSTLGGPQIADRARVISSPIGEKLTKAFLTKTKLRRRVSAPS